MRSETFSSDTLARLLRRRTIATMDELKAALGSSVDMTVFRKLRELDYLASYSHRGKYYVLKQTAELDERGLWAYRGVRFSSIGSLIAGLWAGGLSAEELERMALRFKDPWDIRRLFVLDLEVPLYSIVIGFVAGAFLAATLSNWWLGFLIGFAACLPIGVALGGLAGGPIQGGRVLGETEKLGREIVGPRVRTADLFATLYRACGIETSKKFFNREGKLFKTTDGGTPIKDLL